MEFETKLNTTFKEAVCNHINRLRADSGVFLHHVMLPGRSHLREPICIKRMERVQVEQMNEKEFHEKMSDLKCEFETMKINAYPHFTAESGNTAVIQKTQFDQQKVIWIDEWDRKRECCRCSRQFEFYPKEPVKREQNVCRNHNRGHLFCDSFGRYGNRVKKHTCCRQVYGTAPGCRFENVHVFDQLYKSELNNFVSSPKSSGPDDPRSTKVYAIDCEMAYTTRGPALVRLTMVGKENETVLDVLIKPPGEVLSPNTEFSGLTTKQILGAKDTIESAREKLFQFVNEKTILIGHSFESDLKAMRLCHYNVVDTALLFLRDKVFKSSLKKLAAIHLRQSIQSNNNGLAGHDSFEDAKASMNLALFKLKNPTTF